MRWSRLIGATVLLCAGFTVFAAEPAAPRPVTLDDLERIKSPGAPVISRDGRQIAFELEKQIYVVPTAGGAARAVTMAGTIAWDPHWSRDGRTLFFISDRSGSDQLWKLSLDSFGEASQVTTADIDMDSLNFSNDELRMLLQSTEEAASKRDDKKAEKEEQEESPKPWVITRLEFKEDAGDGYLTGDRAEHLYVLDLAAGKLAQITSGPYSESDPAWSPDGRMIVFTSNREQEPDASYKTDLWIVASDSPDKGRTLLRLTNDERVKSDPSWSPDGRSIAFLCAEDGVYGSPQVAVMAASGGPARILTGALDRWVDSYRWSADGKWIYFLYEHEGGTRLARVRPQDGRLEQLFEGEYNISAFDVARNGTIAVSAENHNDGPEIHAAANGRLQRLTDINGDFLKSVAIGSKESVSFRSSDGTLVQAFVTKPPGFEPGRRYPTILHIHGGPVGQFSWGYSAWVQYFAANGYVVIEPNPRGSTGRGQDFVRGIYQTWGITDYDDLIAAVEHLVALGYADPERLAVTGYSYGGYMTNTVITRTGRFKAAATGAGHSFIYANYGHDIYQKWYNWELGVPWENREKYDRLSPLLQVAHVTTPTIFLGGRNDWNVPLLNAELMYQSLRKRGIDTQLVVYPDTHHSDWSAEFNKDYLQRVHQWFDKYL
ncbi:MAG: S9 family peptidase, partial [Steroidobacteraceae bacterium]